MGYKEFDDWFYYDKFLIYNILFKKKLKRESN